MDDVILRTYLFVPATRIERVSKAIAEGPDAVIVDLEDAVPPADKGSARDAAARELPGAAPVFVRVNGPGTEWFDDDLKLCAQVGVRVPGERRLAQRPGVPLGVGWCGSFERGLQVHWVRPPGFGRVVPSPTCRPVVVRQIALGSASHRERRAE